LLLSAARPYVRPSTAYIPPDATNDCPPEDKSEPSKQEANSEQYEADDPESPFFSGILVTKRTVEAAARLREEGFTYTENTNQGHHQGDNQSCYANNEDEAQ
jgi:hypothetical protein